MNARTFRLIRRRLGISQAEMARAMDCSAANIMFYERGQAVPPPRAKLLIIFARSRGLALTWENLYDDAPLPEIARPVQEGSS